MTSVPQAMPIPVTVVGGFLGAGKTTLLNRILSADHGLRVGVIVNDFGSLAFDEELADATTTHSRLLANGCVCCSIQNDLIETMAEMLGQDPPLEAIVIEASGVADPLSLVATLQGAGIDLSAYVRTVVTVADAGHVREQERDYGGELVLKQLHAAGVIVLNKCDLSDQRILDDTLQWLAEIGVTGELVQAVHGDLPLDLVFGTGRAPALARQPSPHAEQTFEEWTLQTDRTFDPARLRQMFERLPVDIVRAKGIVDLADGEGRMLVQFAAGRLDLSPLAEGSDQRGSRIVAIGPRGKVDAVALDRLFLEGPS